MKMEFEHDPGHFPQYDQQETNSQGSPDHPHALRDTYFVPGELILQVTYPDNMSFQRLDEWVKELWSNDWLREASREVNPSSITPLIPLEGIRDGEIIRRIPTKYLKITFSDLQ